jgi:hypothetical protein
MGTTTNGAAEDVLANTCASIGCGKGGTKQCGACGQVTISCWRICTLVTTELRAARAKLIFAPWFLRSLHEDKQREMIIEERRRRVSPPLP